MIYDRRPYYIVGAAVALLVAAFFYFAPHPTPEQRVARDLAILAREPWAKVWVERTVIEGPAQNPTRVWVEGRREEGTPVRIEFVPGTPYTAPTAVRRAAQDRPRERWAEVLMLPRSMVRRPFQTAFSPNATHVGVALFVGLPDEATAEVEASEEGAGTAAPATSG